MDGMPPDPHSARSGLLNTDDRFGIAAWLSEVGCFRLLPEVELELGGKREVYRRAEVTNWCAEDLTEPILALVEGTRCFHRWLLSVGRKQFQDYLRVFFSLTKDQPFESNSIKYEEFRENLAAAISIPIADVDRFIDFVFEVAIGEYSAGFGFEIEREPRLTLRAIDVFHAMNLQTYFELRYLHRSVTECASCGKSFPAIHRNERFCSAGCRSTFNASSRRLKVKSILKGLDAWNALTDQAREHFDREHWIHNWAQSSLSEQGKSQDLKFTWVQSILTPLLAPKD